MRPAPAPARRGLAGGGAGQFYAPTGVATDSSGDVYVAEYANERIDEFSAGGAFIKAYGWGVSDGASQFETCTSTCQAGIAGGGAGQFDLTGGVDTGGVATDSSGDVYVADSVNARIDEFSAAGAFIEAYGWGVSDGASKFETCTTTCRAGLSTGGAGAFNYPHGVATDSSGDVYVADSADDRIDGVQRRRSTDHHLDESVGWRSVWGERLGAGQHGGERHGHAVGHERLDGHGDGHLQRVLQLRLHHGREHRHGAEHHDARHAAALERGHARHSRYVLLAGVVLGGLR